MKYFLSFLFVICYSINVIAQSSRPLENYKHETKVVIENNTINITVDGKSTLLEALVNNNNLKISPENDKLMMQLLDFNQAQIDSLSSQYKNKFGNISLANKIINRAKETKGIIFKNKANNSLVVVVDSQNGSTTNVSTDDTEYIPAEQPKTNSFLNTIWPWVLGMLATFLVGFFIAKIFSKSKSDSNATTSPDEKELNKKIDEMITSHQKVLQQHKVEIENLKAELTKLKQYDEAYYQAVQTKLVSPYLQAIKDSNNAQIVKSSLAGMTHLVSIMRIKTNIWQDYDKANVEALVNHSKITLSKDKVISNATLADAIPNDIKAIIEVMKKNNITSIDNTNLFGYSIENI